MNKSLLALASTMVAIAALPQLAQAQTAAPAPAAEAAAAPAADPLTFNVGVVSEYRYRGISQSHFKPALQGGADYAFASGAYVGTWLSTIQWIRRAEEAAGTASGGSIEWDLYGGYKGEITKDLTYDVGVLQYYYPANKYGEIGGAHNANTTELYGALTYGPATVKYSHSLSPLFGAGRSENSSYLEAAATFDLGHGFSIAPHVGYQHVAGSVGGVSNNVFSYTDYSVTGGYDFGNGLTLSLALIGTSTKTPAAGGYAYPDGVDTGKNLGRTTAVVGAKYSF